MGKNYSAIDGTSKDSFVLGKNKIALQSGQFTPVNGQVSPADVDGFAIDATKNAAFKAVLSTTRKITANAFIAVQPNGTNKRVNQIIPGSSSTAFVVGDFTGGIYKLNADGSLITAFETNKGTGFNGEVIGIIAAFSKFMCFGSFTSYNGVTRNRVCFIDADGADDPTLYDLFGASGGGGTGFNGTVTCAYAGDYSGLALGGIVVGGSFTTFNGVSCEKLVQAPTNVNFASYNVSSYGTGTPKVLYPNFPGSSLLVAGISSSGTPSHHITSVTGVSALSMFTGSSGFDDEILCLYNDPMGNIYIGGKFDNYNGSPYPKLCKFDYTGVPVGGYAPFAATAGNYVSCIIQLGGQAFVSGKFDDFTSKNYISLNDDGTEDTVYTAQFGSGFTNPIKAFETNNDTSAAIAGGVFFGEEAIAATANNTFGYVATRTLAQGVTLLGVYNYLTGGYELSSSATWGPDVGIPFTITLSGQLKYTSTYLAASSDTIKYLITKL